MSSVHMIKAAAPAESGVVALCAKDRALQDGVTDKLFEVTCVDCVSAIAEMNREDATPASEPIKNVAPATCRECGKQLTPSDRFRIVEWTSPETGKTIKWNRCIRCEERRIKIMFPKVKVFRGGKNSKNTKNHSEAKS